MNLAERFDLTPLDLEFSMPYEKFSKLVKHRVRKKEPKWLLAIKYFIEIRAAQLRRWTDFMAIREFVQNALDEADRFDARPTIKIERNKLIISNPSRKLLPKHLKLGGSDKECWERGRYGEGLKVAAMKLLPASDVYIYSHDNAYRLLTDGKDLYLLIGEIPSIGERTVVEIYNPPPVDIEKMIYSPPTFIEAVYSSEYCPYNKPSRIKKEPPNLLYVRDIYVNTLKELTGLPSVYTYNLWWVELSEDRIHVTSTDALLTEIARLINDKLTKDQMKELAEDLINRTSKPKPYGLEIDTDYLEYNLLVTKSYRLYDFIRTITEVLKARGIQAWANTPREALLALRHDVKVVYAPNFTTKLPSVEEFLISQLEETGEKYERNLISPKALNLMLTTPKYAKKINMNFAIYEVLYVLLGYEFGMAKKPKPQICYVESEDNIIGMHSAEKIIENLINLPLFSTDALAHCIHEITHYLTGSPDETAAFERDLTKISSRIITGLVNLKEVPFLSAALDGFLLTPYIDYDFPEVEKVRTSQYRLPVDCYTNSLKILSKDLNIPISPLYHYHDGVLTRFSLSSDSAEPYYKRDFKLAIKVCLRGLSEYLRKPYQEGEFIVFYTQFKEKFPLEPEIKVEKIPAEEL